ncbi:hypothetical protein [Serratia liquefaciens]|uniref:hypothetical protein n=1 Tax=Serratia liquefaciens TaxID=614 RepID=UPI001F16B114|nr:hypothetical protein [Serratia liquefaciens]
MPLYRHTINAAVNPSSTRRTANHKKEVAICIITPSVSYSFGKTGAEHKEMDITVPARATTYAYQSN